MISSYHIEIPRRKNMLHERETVISHWLYKTTEDECIKIKQRYYRKDYEKIYLYLSS